MLTTSEAKPKGVAVSRTRAVHGADATIVSGIPVTTIARTLVDLAAVLGDEALGRVCHEALVRDRATPRKAEAVLVRRPTSPGAARLRRLLHGDEPLLLSRLESRFLQLLRGANLPLPQTNRQAGGHWVDCRWPERFLTVELDGYRFHNSRQAWEKDRARERAARARGDEHRRYTWADVVDRPEGTLAELRALLAPR